MVASTNEPRGVDGWLALLILTLIFIGPFFGFGRTASDLEHAEFTYPQLVGSPAWGQVKVVSWVSWLTQTILSVYAGLRLKSDHAPSAVRYTIIILWFNAIVLTILYFGTLSLIPSYGPSAAVGSMISSLIAGVVGASIWTVYLLRSKRVRNTYYASLRVESAAIALPPHEIVEQADVAAPPLSSLELYDRRFDWMLCFLLVLVPVWALYGLSAGLASAPAFLLIALLKPLRSRLGTLMNSGVFAAGACLLATPLLLIASDLDSFMGIGAWFRSFVLPLIGLGLVLNSWLRQWKDEQKSGRIIRGILRWGAFPLAAVATLIWIFPPVDVISEVASESEMAPEAYPPNYGQTYADGLNALMRREKAEREAEARLNSERDLPTEPLQLPKREPVTMRWLVGDWAPMNDGSSDPAIYCATDIGYRFERGGQYSGAAEFGRFEINDGGDRLNLTERSGFSNGLESELVPVAPAFLDVSRMGERLVIDGETFGRCQ